jgi:hypothetical protein
MKQIIHPELIRSKDLIFNPCHFECSEPIIEAQSAEYGAYIFKLNSTDIRFRVAKITPTKVGQFVTLWKRIGNGPIQPYDMEDPIELFIIATVQADKFGQFIFPKSTLYKHGIISKNNQGGKRAIRVYPPWDITTNKQAKKTQAWQLEYFLDVPNNEPINLYRAYTLYSLTG